MSYVLWIFIRIICAKIGGQNEVVRVVDGWALEASEKL
jgi:hypothetical protein